MRGIVVLVLAVFAVVLSVSPAQAAPDGTLRLTSTTVKIGDPITFSFSTPRPDAQNWVGLYQDPGNGPVNEEFVGPSTKWVYTPESSGTGSLPTEGLPAGDWIVYYLYNDGYTWLAQPVKLQLVASGPVSWVSSAFPLRNGQVGSDYSASVARLVRGNTAGLSFRKVSGPSWLTVSPGGTAGGTPTASGTITAGIEASNSTGSKATATVTIRVQASGAALVPELKVMSYNLWHGGTPVNGYRDKQLKFLLDRDVDVVGIQENEGTSAQALADALGWSYHQNSDVAILSRYPISATGSGTASVWAKVRLGTRSAVLWSAHLGYTPYGPYDACFGGMSVQQLMDRESRSGRTGQINSIISAMNTDLANSGSTPVFLVGDFNAPSHLDWTSANSHCGYGQVSWPTSTAPVNAGLTDSYRAAHPNPATAPGITWSPIYKTFTGGYGYDSHTGEPEPQDRIDFVYFKGALDVLSSEAVVEGDPALYPNHQNNAWTSDHAAVLTTFRIR
ncbi:endonuclease/exonuclease/phosphatase family protein [Nonomuraea jiangxiensis]|uniref:Exonuclease III n=1 Tax=Nonomuraea jiangxiensis TaxID=633440 RepID=A0A1G8S2F7_9ACTN|nr:endonuclease/exonuclease/phosphatase family protein [Nonomuraea jiangxiensis]SDJ23312.1 Exonuclease III [Nonomuraea jiangxiensis]